MKKKCENDYVTKADVAYIVEYIIGAIMIATLVTCGYQLGYVLGRNDMIDKLRNACKTLVHFNPDAPYTSCMQGEP